MAHNPHAPQGPQEHDPAGSTQMFRAFVDDDTRSGPSASTSSSGGSRLGLILGIAVGVVVLAVVAWVAFG
ncbi:hypothetical protein [Streptomyces alkaliphilus]|uniref:Uncharacterized protein n=1 Tax=Streptomyces alkaliphilus TaxID=1472722 RepID=A0A7W3THK8_9ACTN|nr:hypothetical protein [Streptomyces alkaliphilus]MBB0246998.1 hypothetical protein [Streptomyces alkaliphilus]MQS09764.1 hypothetical protein [Streptomyces alkaliphilus]